MSDIGTAYVRIEPTAKGISGKIEKEHYFYQLLSKEKEIAGKWLT